MADWLFRSVEGDLQPMAATRRAGRHGLHTAPKAAAATACETACLRRERRAARGDSLATA